MSGFGFDRSLQRSELFAIFPKKYFVDALTTCLHIVIGKAGFGGILGN